MRRKPWTKVSLHRQLLNLLERPTTILRHSPIRDKEIAATVEFDHNECPISDLIIEVDANKTVNVPVVHYVVHELLHIVFYERLLGCVDETLEEVIIVGLDGFVFDHIKSSKERLSKWQALIQRKLKESTPPEPKPLADLVDRRADEARS